MKVLVVFIALLLFTQSHLWAHGDSTFIVPLSQLPPHGKILDTGWRFQAGDNIDWARPEFNDTAWPLINPTADIFDLPQLIQPGIGWFRLHLRVDSTLLKESLVLLIAQIGASEIYLNGKRIYTFGEVSPNQKEIKTFDPLNQPVSIQFDKGTSQVLAVRFALKKKVPYFKFIGFPNRCFLATINTTNQAIKVATGKIIFFPEIFRMGLFSILAILHFALFLLNKKIRANLFFSLFALVATLYPILYMGGSNLNRGGLTTPDVELKMYLLSAATILYNLHHLLFLKALNIVVQYRKKRIYQLFFIGFLVSIPLYFWPYSFGWIFPFLIVPSAILIECARISFLAMKQKQKGAMLLVIGATGFLIFYAAFYVGYFFGLGSLPNIFFDITFNIGECSLPVATSIFLALEFAFMNRSLEKRLLEVKILSKQAVAQEQEKRQLLASQNESLENQVNQRTAELQQSIQKLKATQTQLVQKEKLASLGELTAGIAHEIQNPLNLVNNFSEVSVELLEEMEKELITGDKEDAVILAANVRQNLQKIIQHGQRADAIVKGMLLHSRASSGEKQLTDLNALVEEYLRLSYHGLRAKDENFNANLVIDFDSSMGQVEVVPQEIGRVLLNLYSNAFYATQQKKNQLNGQYQPEVQVGTRQHNGTVEITVRDNGVGMPEHIRNKIFQPFFTTKPAGQGTGLGLSLSYDIITKGHGGELKVESKEGAYTEFMIVLPRADKYSTRN